MGPGAAVRVEDAVAKERLHGVLAGIGQDKICEGDGEDWEKKKNSVISGLSSQSWARNQLTVLEILGIPSGDCLVQQTMGDIGVSVPVMAVANEIQVAKFATSPHRLDDEVDADETLLGLDEVRGTLEPLRFRPSGAVDTAEDDAGQGKEQEKAEKTSSNNNNGHPRGCPSHGRQDIHVEGFS